LSSSPSIWRRLAPYLVFAAVILAFFLAEWAGGANPGCTLAPEPSTGGNPVSAPSTGGSPAAVSESPAQPTQSGTVNLSSLPKEAADTLRLIKQGGPFPYSKDDTVFSNYEGLLPAKSKGYYHEYTVITPGSPDRGARRIVAGAPGEYYYTGDHYRSFRRIVE
jgi:ribonuclease T1